MTSIRRYRTGIHSGADAPSFYFGYAADDVAVRHIPRLMVTRLACGLHAGRDLLPVSRLWDPRAGRGLTIKPYGWADCHGGPDPRTPCDTLTGPRTGEDKPNVHYTVFPIVYDTASLGPSLFLLTRTGPPRQTVRPEVNENE